jgi:hypothetical protein
VYLDIAEDLNLAEDLSLDAVDVVTHVMGHCSCEDVPTDAKSRPTVEDVNTLRERRSEGMRLVPDEREREQLTYEHLASAAGLSIFETLYYVQGHVPETYDVPPVEDDQPWRERAVMKSLFHEEQMFFVQMAAVLGCHDETARNWISIHDISPEGTHHTSSKQVRSLTHLDVDPYEPLEDIVKREQERRRQAKESAPQE